ncbi:MAG: DUF4835 family protein [Chitinophagales bacterium]
MKRNIGIFFLLILFTTGKIVAQELNAKVVVQTPKLQLADPKIFKTLENDIAEFLNTRKWTNDSYQTQERIDCSFLITISEELAANRFNAQIIVQSDRPVYSSSYNTVMLNYQDKNWTFEYTEFQPLEYNDNAYLSELTAVLAYYTYIIIGLDYDSFSPEGGNPYFLRAQSIVNNAQNARNKSKGWTAFDGNQNRYWLIENLMSNKFKNLRKAYFDYHLNGLDMLSSNQKNARTAINNALKLIQQVNQNTPNSMAVDIFVQAKSNEILDIFASDEVGPPEKSGAYNAMIKIDPANKPKYKKISSISVGKDKENAVPARSVPNSSASDRYNNPQRSNSRSGVTPSSRTKGN